MNRLSFLRSTYVMFCVSVHFCPEKSFILFNCVKKLEILISFVLNVSSMLNNLSLTLPEIRIVFTSFYLYSQCINTIKITNICVTKSLIWKCNENLVDKTIFHINRQLCTSYIIDYDHEISFKNVTKGNIKLQQ